MRCACFLLVCVLAVLLCGCGSSSSSSSDLPTVTVNISPLNVTVSLGATQQFTATTYGSSDTGVIWYVNDVQGGNSTYGTITQDGLYKAPTTAPNPASVTVRAVSHKNPAGSANANVNLMSGVAVSISPSSVDLRLGGTQQFTATVTGTSDSSVTWQVGGVTGGNSTVGTISTSGLYTAPTSAGTPQSVSVKAISKVDSTKSATVTITLHGNVSVGVSPSSASVQTLGTQQFTATVSGTSNNAVTWQVDGVNGGTSTTGSINSDGLYRAPRSVPTRASNGRSHVTTVTITAVSHADASMTASVPVTIYSPNQTQQKSPTPLGVSGGNADAASGSTCCGGTLGSLVSRGGNQYILSASHVLAPSRAARVGDSIVQPGLLDSGCSTSGTSSIAGLSQFVDLTNSSSTSLVDAALARVIAGKVDAQGTVLQLGDSITDGEPSDGAPHAGSGIAPSVNLAVAKSGRSTGLTCATIGAINVTMSLEFENGCGSGQMYQTTLHNLVSIFGGEFSAEGDSGSLIVSQDTADPVALLIASTDADTVGVPVSDVLTAMADPGTGELPVFVGSASTHRVAGCTVSAAQASSTTALSARAIEATSDKRQAAIGVRDVHASELLSNAVVQAVGVGSSLDRRGEPAVLLFVRKGQERSRLPRQLDGIPTRIIEVAESQQQGILSAAESSALEKRSTTSGMASLTASEIERARKAQSGNTGYLLGLNGVQGVGITASADNPDEAALMIFVVSGTDQSAIPSVVGGLRTRVRESSRARAGFGRSMAGNSCSWKTTSVAK